jgi:hypothetical protein
VDKRNKISFHTGKFANFWFKTKTCFYWNVSIGLLALTGRVARPIATAMHHTIAEPGAVPVGSQSIFMVVLHQTADVQAFLQARVILQISTKYERKSIATDSECSGQER